MDDIERGLQKIPQNGYPALGDWIAEDPDSETFIFRKFDRLSARNLLFLQSQIFALEAESDKLDAELYDAGPELRESMRRSETFLKRAREQPDGAEAKRLKLANDITTMLKQYHEALALHSSISHLGRPRESALKLFRAWFSGQSRGSSVPIISGRAKAMLDDEDDLVSLREATEKDFLTRFMHNHWPSEGKPGQRIKGNSRYVRRRHVSQAVAFVTVVAAVLELVGAIVSLFFVTGRDPRLGLICAWTLLFGLSLRFLSNAKRAEVFGASAAYAAILVVFVSGDLGQGGGGAAAAASSSVCGGNSTVIT